LLVSGIIECGAMVQVALRRSLDRTLPAGSWSGE
jgi:hypothetical protein